LETKPIVLIDHDDSFTHNLVGLVESAGGSALVISYHQIPNFDFSDYQKIILSPGPGVPSDYPLTFKWIEAFHTQKTILGICLGHQILASYFGLELLHQNRVVHGKRKICIQTHASNQTILKNLPGKFKVGLYHSWFIAEPPEEHQMLCTCRSEDGQIMGLVHQNLPIECFQFHPESYMCEYGLDMMKNWLNQ